MTHYVVTVHVFESNEDVEIEVDAEDASTATEYVAQNEYTDGNEAILVGVEQI